MNKINKNNIIVLTLILIIGFISIGYSFLETSLNIGGIAQVKKYAPPVTIPKFSYTGNYEVVQDDDTIIPESEYETYSGNWKIRFLSSGDLSFSSLNGAANGIDVFLVGGGGKGSSYAWNNYNYGGGGGGGYTHTIKNLQITTGEEFSIVVGAPENDTAAFGFLAARGKNGGLSGGRGGSGGGGNGQAGGEDGTGGLGRDGGSGQSVSTREFGEANGRLYAHGGNGASPTENGAANTGNGGGGSKYQGLEYGNGGSGIVIIRNARETAYLKNKNIPEFTYTGNYEIVNDSDAPIGASDVNWKIRFLTSGTLTVTNLNGAANGIDVFLVGGGGEGSSYGWGSMDYGGAGGGGYTNTIKNVQLNTSNSYSIVVGDPGNASSAFDFSAAGGENGGYPGGNGGSGGATGGVGVMGGIDGNNGGGTRGGIGQGTTTREFGEDTGTLYASGGNGNSPSTGGARNTGDGGGGSAKQSLTAASGGSGIVIIRNKR